MTPAGCCYRYFHWQCAWPGRAKRCSMRLSAATTASPTSSWAATTQASVATTGLTMRRRLCGSTRKISGLRCLRMRRWSTCRRQVSAHPDVLDCKRFGAPPCTTIPHTHTPLSRTRRRAAGQFLPADRVPNGAATASISGTQFRALMASGDPIPPWYSDSAVIRLLRAASPPRHQRGFVLFFTGLSGSGKTTIAGAVAARLGTLLPTRRVRLLDGDDVRTHLSKVRKCAPSASEVAKGPRRTLLLRFCFYLMHAFTRRGLGFHSRTESLTSLD